METPLYYCRTDGGLTALAYARTVDEASALELARLERERDELKARSLKDVMQELISMESGGQEVDKVVVVLKGKVRMPQYPNLSYRLDPSLAGGGSYDFMSGRKP